MVGSQGRSVTPRSEGPILSIIAAVPATCRGGFAEEWAGQLIGNDRSVACVLLGTDRVRVRSLLGPASPAIQPLWHGIFLRDFHRAGLALLPEDLWLFVIHRCDDKPRPGDKCREDIAVDL